MAGGGGDCRPPRHCRTVSADERNTSVAGNRGRRRAGASPAPSRACVRAHRSLRLRDSSPIGRPPAPHPRGARRTDLAGHPGTTPLFPGGRPLVSGYVSGFLGLLAVLFALITWQVAVEGPLLRLDERVGGKLFGHGPAPLTQVFSDLGGMPVALPVLTCALGYALWRGARRLAVYAALTMAAVPALVIPLKVATARQGPLTEAVNYFPSGHTATAAVAYGASALVLMTLPRPSWLREASAPGVDDARRRDPVDHGDGHRSGAARLPLAAGRAGQLVPGASGARAPMVGQLPK